VNDKQRVQFYCEDATKIYMMLYKCAEVANRTLAAGMLRRCNMATQEKREPIPGYSFEGYWDGHMAYQLLYNELFACARTEADKTLYLAALEVQEKHQLPDHCHVSMFEGKAYAFQHHIAPHLARTFAPEDAAHYIIKMMPKCLKESGRALRERLIERDQLTDLQIVVSHCVVIVAEDQLTAASATLFNALSFPCLIASPTRHSARSARSPAWPSSTPRAAPPAAPTATAAPAGAPRAAPARGSGALPAHTPGRTTLGAPTGRASSTLASRSTFRPASGPTKLELTP